MVKVEIIQIENEYKINEILSWFLKNTNAIDKSPK